MSSGKGFPKEAWTPVPNRIVDLILNGQVTGELKLEIWVWMNLGRKFVRTFEPGKVIGLTAARAQKLTGVEDRRNAARVRNRVLAHLGMVQGKEDGTYIEANPDIGIDRLGDTSNRFESNGLNATSDTPSDTQRDTPGDTPRTSKLNAGEPQSCTSRINLKKYTKENCVRSAGPLAPCDAIPIIEILRQNPEIQLSTEDSKIIKNTSYSVPVIHNESVDNICPLDAFIESIPFIDDDNTPNQDLHNPASPDQINGFNPSLDSCGSAYPTTGHPTPPGILPSLPAASPAASSQKAEALALALVNDYNAKASAAKPGLFEAVDLFSEECKDIVQRFARVLEAEPNCFNDLKAIIAALSNDLFYQGHSRMGHVWTLRFISFQKVDRITKHGLKARMLLSDLAEREGRVASIRGIAPSLPLNRRPVHRRDADQHNADQLLSAFGG